MNDILRQIEADLAPKPGDQPRRILVCGSRSWTDRKRIERVLFEYMPEEAWADEPTIIHGGAKGADRIAGDVAMWAGFWVEAHPANWRKHGKAAGPLRNRAMLDTKPDLVIAFQVDGSRGTQDCIDEARRRGIPVRVEAA